MAVEERLKNYYLNAYGEDHDFRWRHLGALGKADNVIALWEQAGLAPRPRVLEIGCGDGAIANVLAERQFFIEYAGYELAETGVAHANSRNIANATFHVTEGATIPAEDHSYDLVLLSHVVEHLEHPRILIYEARRIGAHVIVEVPLELHMRTPHNFVRSHVGHINSYNATSIRHLLQSCDLEVLGERLSHPSQEILTGFYGTDPHSVARWRIKEALLRVVPSIAQMAFTYHSTILAKPIQT